MTARGIRYGLFFLPPAELADPSARGYLVAERLHGFRAAGKYPPHVTLLGSMAADDEDALLAEIEVALKGAGPQNAWCTGLHITAGWGLRWEFTDSPGASSHAGISSMFRRIVDVTEPSRTYTPDDRAASDRLDDERNGAITPHLSIVSHDGPERPEGVQLLARSMRAARLDMTGPVVFNTVGLYRFESDDWEGEYWHSMTWTLRHLWTLTDGAAR